MLPRAVRSSGVTGAAPRCCAAFVPAPSQLARLQRQSRFSRALASCSRRRTDGTASQGRPFQQPPLPQARQPPPELSQAVTTSIVTCPGCGGLAQTVDHGEAGFYDVSRKTVKHFLENDRSPFTSENASTHNDAFDRAATAAGSGLEAELQALKEATDTAHASAPLCDRCHNLLNYNSGDAIAHPSIDSIRETIQESPYTDNHIYHIIDAADFPLSLVRSISRDLDVVQKVSRNRRGHDKPRYRHGKKLTIGYIITRSDLLAPKKEQVDSLMPYIRRVLQTRLTKGRDDIRLGDVSCVSAKRDWWTAATRLAIGQRHGATWLVGRVNVGKSNLVETIYPKPRPNDASSGSSDEATAARASATQLLAGPSLLPPAKAEVPYPVMPTVSELPGTTASPIRLPYGRGRGELIDLPGLARDVLDDFVQPDCHSQLIMKARPTPKQFTLRSGTSLVIGGLIRISALTEDVVFLAHTFVPLNSTKRSDAKLAEEKAAGRDNLHESSVAKAGTTHHLQSAGQFELKWDITRARAGPLTRPSAVGLKPERLPFRVLSTDIVIAGVGWVEISAQVSRAKYPDHDDGNVRKVGEAYRAGATPLPRVEVFSPEGRFVGTRETLGAWELNKPPKKEKGSPRWKRG